MGWRFSRFPGAGNYPVATPFKTGDRCSTQLAKMNIDPEFVELAADVVRIFHKTRKILLTLRFRRISQADFPDTAEIWKYLSTRSTRTFSATFGFLEISPRDLQERCGQYTINSNI